MYLAFIAWFVLLAIRGSLAFVTVCLWTRSAAPESTLIQTRSVDAQQYSYEIDVETQSSRNPILVFPGGGIFFYWQAGAVTYLREAGYDLTNVPAVGASAGALVATLTKYDVDFEEATDLALSLCEQYNVWDRPLGLFGIWGGIIEEWLDALLPDSISTHSDQLSILLTTLPFLRKSKVTSFVGKRDLIACNMASVHLPWFLNNNPVASFRGETFIDGSFMSKIDDYCCERDYDRIILDWSDDLVMEAMSGDFVKAIDDNGIRNIFKQGRKYAEKLDGEGAFKILSKTRIARRDFKKS